MAQSSDGLSFLGQPDLPPEECHSAWKAMPQLRHWTTLHTYIHTYSGYNKYFGQEFKDYGHVVPPAIAALTVTIELFPVGIR